VAVEVAVLGWMEVIRVAMRPPAWSTHRIPRREVRVAAAQIFAPIVVKMATSASDVTIVDTLASNSFGIALYSDTGATARLERTLIASSRGVGVYAFGLGTDVELIGTDILDTGPRTCSTELCSQEPAGMGIGAYEGAHISATDFSVRGAAFCGIHLGPGASVDLHNGEITGNDIGACVHEPDYDLSRLTDGVLYDGNRNIPIETRTIPIPDPPRFPVDELQAPPQPTRQNDWTGRRVERGLR